jgi:hypothetical protein
VKEGIVSIVGSLAKKARAALHPSLRRDKTNPPDEYFSSGGFLFSWDQVVLVRHSPLHVFESLLVLDPVIALGFHGAFFSFTEYEQKYDREQRTDNVHRNLLAAFPLYCEAEFGSRIKVTGQRR